jgi:hypothetical protein
LIKQGWAAVVSPSNNEAGSARDNTVHPVAAQAVPKNDRVKSALSGVDRLLQRCAEFVGLRVKPT